MWSISIFLVFLVFGSSCIDAATKHNFGPFAKYNTYEDFDSVMIGRKPTRNLGILQLGGSYGTSKRFVPPSKTEKHRRGPLNGLMPGGAFGRAARSNNFIRGKNYEKILKGPLDIAAIPSFISFDGERNDGQGMRAFIDKGSKNIDAYTPYQYKHFLGNE